MGLGAEADLVAAAVSFDFEDEDVDAHAHLVTLRRMLIEPLELDASLRRIRISPTGALTHLPFGAVLPEREVVCVPSATVHAVLGTLRRAQTHRILALGDPAYASATARSSWAQERNSFGYGKLHGALPATRAEVEAIADPKRGSVRLLGREATETALIAALQSQPRWRAVHLACHGLANPERPMLSSLALVGDEANDGYLTALDVLRLRIEADLVCLSACNTGRGRIVRGEGVLGLARAFFFAGSQRVIVSQWKVPDEASSFLMRTFYELWNPAGGTGLTAAAALREAQARTRAQARWKHPYFWGAWTLWGRS